MVHGDPFQNLVQSCVFEKKLLRYIVVVAVKHVGVCRRYLASGEFLWVQIGELEVSHG